MRDTCDLTNDFMLPRDGDLLVADLELGLLGRGHSMGCKTKKHIRRNKIQPLNVSTNNK